VRQRLVAGSMRRRYVRHSAAVRMRSVVSQSACVSPTRDHLAGRARRRECGGRANSG